MRAAYYDGYGDRGCERSSLQNGCAVLRWHGICQNAEREDSNNPAEPGNDPGCFLRG